MFETYLGISLGGAIFIALILLLKSFLKKGCRHRASYILWIILMLCLLIPYRLNLPQITLSPQIPLDRYGVNLNLDELSYTITNTASSEGTEDPLAKLSYFNYEDNSAFIVGLSFSTILMMIWIAGMGIFFLYQIIRSLIFRKKCRALPYLPASGDMLDLFQAGKREYKVKRKVELRVVKDIPCPMTRGFLHPVIYMPHDIIFPDALYLLICHELLQIKRMSPVFKALSYLASGIHWFNPLVHIARRQMAVDGKMAADEKVLADESLRMRESYVAALDGVNCDHPIADFFYISERAAQNRRAHILDEKKKRMGFLLLLLGIPLVVLSVSFLHVGFSDAIVGHWQSARNAEIADDDPAAAAESFILAENDAVGASTFKQTAFTSYAEDGTTAQCLFTLGSNVNWLVELASEGDLWIPSRYQVLNDAAAQVYAASLVYDHLMEDFSYPGSAEELGKAWADAFSKRNGAVQYNLMTAENQDMVKTYFKSLNWYVGDEDITITSYDITADNLARIAGYEIVFHRVDSDGKALADVGYFLGIEEVDGKWQIAEIDNICNSIDGEQVLVSTYPLLAAMADAANLSSLVPPEAGMSQRENDDSGTMTYLLASQIEVYTDSPPVYVLSETKDNETRVWSYQIYPYYYRVLSVPE